MYLGFDHACNLLVLLAIVRLACFAQAMDFGEGMQSYYDSEDSDDDRSQVRNPRFLRVED